MPGAFEADQTGQRQEIADAVFNIRPQDTPFTSMIPKIKKPKRKILEWQLEAYPDVGHTGIMDGADVATFESVPREMAYGIAHKFRRPWHVSDFADVTTVAGLASGERGRQKAVAATLLKFMLEQRLLSSADQSQDNGSSVPNETRGAHNWLSVTEQTGPFPIPASFRPAANTQHTSTLGALTETAFRSLLDEAYKVRYGRSVLDGIVGIDLKAHMDDWSVRVSDVASNTAVRQFTQSAASKQIMNVVDFLNFSSGEVRLHCSNYQLRTEATGATSANTDLSGLFLDMKMWALAFMRVPGMRELEDAGGGPRGFADTIAVLVCRNPLGQPVVNVAS